MLGLCIVSAMALILAGYLGVGSPTRNSERMASVPIGSDATPEQKSGPSISQLLRALQITANGGGIGPGITPGTRFDTPKETVAGNFYGIEVRHPGMVDSSGALFFVSDAIDGYPVTPRRPEVPAAVTPLTPLASCTPRRPEPGEVVANIHVHDGGRVTGLNATNTVELGNQVLGWVQRVQSRSTDLSSAPRIKGNPVEAITVVLTDTAAPQYLILQSSQPTVWNIQISPGVEIAHVVMVGRKGQALHAPGDGYGVEALLIGDDCAPVPARKPADFWQMYDHAQVSREHETRATDAHTAYTNWFESAFGFPSEQGATGAWITSHVLVGPLPATPIPYRPIDGAILRAVPDERMLFGTEAQLADTLRIQALEIAMAAAGGDLSILQPAPKER